jgi:aspartate carbamoyltransferase catalytic subunit
MSSRKKSLIQLSSLDQSQIREIFNLADGLSSGKIKGQTFQGLTGALLFLEASTRTRLSFETACAREGVYPLIFSGGGTSLEKGETYEDTVLNIAAMDPAFMIIRSSDDLDMEAIQGKISMPVINAGWGRKGHPTQALLDIYTLYKKFGSVEGQRLLIVGDVIHSRVAASHFELSKILGYELAFCGPKEFLPQWSEMKVISTLKEGLEWATAAMALRVQLERHDSKYSLSEYRHHYGFTAENLKALSANAAIMHPGPINQNTELDSGVLQDPRIQVLQQVRHGVYIRQALIHQIVSGGQS